MAERSSILEKYMDGYSWNGEDKDSFRDCLIEAETKCEAEYYDDQVDRRQRYDCIEFISHAFCWNHSVEGHNFWLYVLMRLKQISNEERQRKMGYKQP